jgi:hypothetical protein
VLSQFRGEALKYIFGAILASIGGLFLYYWHDFTDAVHRLVIEEIISDIEDDLKKGEDSILLKTVPTKITDRYSHIFGEIATGSMYITDANQQSNKVDIFVPSGHEGRIRIQIVSDLPKNSQITMQGPKGLPQGMPKPGEYSYPLTTFLATNSALVATNSTGTQMSEPDLKYFANVYTLTFALRPLVDSNNNAGATVTERVTTETPIQIKYIVVVSPPLQSDDLP